MVEIKKCEKLIYRKVNSLTPSILLGIVIYEDQFVIKFQTSKNAYTISKAAIITIEPTNEIFRGGDQ